MRSVSDLAGRSLGVSGSVCFGTRLCTVRSLPGDANLRVEIVPDGPTSFVGATTVKSVITDSDYTSAAVLRQPAALTQADDGSSQGDAVSRRSRRSSSGC